MKIRSIIFITIVLICNVLANPPRYPNHYIALVEAADKDNFNTNSTSWIVDVPANADGSWTNTHTHYYMMTYLTAAMQTELENATNQFPNSRIYDCALGNTIESVLASNGLQRITKNLHD